MPLQETADAADLQASLGDLAGLITGASALPELVRRVAAFALHMIIISRVRHDDATTKYRDKKLPQGRSTIDAIRALKRYVAREIDNVLKQDLIIA